MQKYFKLTGAILSLASAVVAVSGCWGDKKDKDNEVKKENTAAQEPESEKDHKDHHDKDHKDHHDKDHKKKDHKDHHDKDHKDHKDKKEERQSEEKNDKSEGTETSEEAVRKEVSANDDNIETLWQDLQANSRMNFADNEPMMNQISTEDTGVYQAPPRSRRYRTLPRAVSTYNNENEDNVFGSAASIAYDENMV